MSIQQSRWSWFGHVLPNPQFYGWRLVAAACAMQMIQAAFFHNAFGLYFAVLHTEYGWSKTALSGAAALQPMESALLGPAVGWMVDRFGPRRLVRIGIVIFSAGFLLLATIDTLTGFYLAILLISLGSCFCGYFPLTVAVVRWFEKSRGRALSALSFGLALGGSLIPLIAASMQAWGWRPTALGSGVLILLIGLPLARAMKDHPDDIGEIQDGHGAPAVSQERAAAVTPSKEFTAAEALRTWAFWLISLGHGFALLVVYAVNVHAVSHIKTSMGYTLAQASLVMSVVTAGQLLGVFLGGWAGDRYPKRYLAAACMISHAVALALLAFAWHPSILVVFGLLHGVAWGMRGPMMQAIRADYFGSKAIGMILGISSMVIVLGQVGGPMVAGILADWTGSYRLGFILLSILVGLGSLFFVLAKKP
jgi:MFS family permease